MEQGQLDEYAARTAQAIELVDSSLIDADVDLTIEQIIVKADATIGHYHLVLRSGEASVHPGPATEPDITIKQDSATAEALRNGSLHAQGAFLTGRLSVDGDIKKLVEHGPLLNQLLTTQPQQ